MVGIFKNIALLVHVTVAETSTDEMAALVHGLVHPSYLCTLDELAWDVRYTLIINGVIVSYINPAKFQALEHDLRKARRCYNMSPYTSIYPGTDGTTLHVDCNAGRMLNPLIVSETVCSGFFFEVCKDALRHGNYDNLMEELVLHGCIEYICANEEASCWIATTWDHWFGLQGIYTRGWTDVYSSHDSSCCTLIMQLGLCPECNQGPQHLSGKNVDAGMSLRI